MQGSRSTTLGRRSQLFRNARSEQGHTRRCLTRKAEPHSDMIVRSPRKKIRRGDRSTWTTNSWAINFKTRKTVAELEQLRCTLIQGSWISKSKDEIWEKPAIQILMESSRSELHKKGRNVRRIGQCSTHGQGPRLRVSSNSIRSPAGLRQVRRVTCSERYRNRY